MDPSEPRIEIFAPFGEAFELMQKILFRPFDIGKWFVIGFAAWLATFFNGAGFNYQTWNRNNNWNWKSQAHLPGASFSLHDAPPWLIPVLVIGALLALAFITLLLWLNARGRFMFTDCIVRNRGAIAEPWREYRVEGNRYFVFAILVALASLVVFGGLGCIVFIGWYWGNPVVPVALLILIGVAVVLAALIVGLVMRFMVPVMYRQRCGPLEAFRAVWSLFTAQPGVFVLFALFYILIGLAAVMIGCLATCLTCCLAALPYIGTVILLPVVMVLFAFPLCFLRQFGDPYDVWAVVKPPEPPLPPAVPPVQNVPPPV